MGTQVEKVEGVYFILVNGMALVGKAAWKTVSVGLNRTTGEEEFHSWISGLDAPCQWSRMMMQDRQGNLSPMDSLIPLPVPTLVLEETHAYALIVEGTDLFDHYEKVQFQVRSKLTLVQPGSKVPPVSPAPPA